jgi:GNAT superfamily N-acetyltransferase
VIRTAVPADVPTIAALIRALAEYEHLAHEVVLDETVLQRHLFGPRPYAEVLIAEADDEPVGFALFFHNFSTFLGRPGIYLEDLFVRPEARGRGLGTALLVELGRLARERDCGRIEWAVLDWNEPSIAFYRSLGAAPKDEWVLYRLTGEPMAALAERAR